MPETDPQRVPYSLPCVGCGYDLVGLDESGPCPECGVPIGRSVSGDHLFASSKAHREKLAHGARLALWGAWAGWVSLGLLAIDVLVGTTLPASGVRSWPMVLAQVPLWLALSATMVLAGLGWVKLTPEDPDQIDSARRPWTGRLLLRGWAAYAVLAGLCILPLYLLLSISESSYGWPGGLEVARYAVLFGWPALALSGSMAQEVAILARRVLEGDLADRTRGLAITGWVTLSLLVLPMIIAAATLVSWGLLGPPGRWWGLVQPVCHAIAGVAAIAWAIQYHTLVRSLRVALAAVAARP